jgi:hypothetical protein
MAFTFEIGSPDGSTIEHANSAKQTFSERLLTANGKYVSRKYSIQCSPNENDIIVKVDQGGVESIENFTLITLQKIPTFENFTDLLQPLSEEQLKALANFSRYGRGQEFGTQLVEQGLSAAEGAIEQPIEIPSNIQMNSDGVETFQTHLATESLERAMSPTLTAMQRAINLRNQAIKLVGNIIK